MGEHHQIEVYPSNQIDNTQKFIDFVSLVLNLLTKNSAEVMRFTDSIHLIQEGNILYFSYHQTSIVATKIDTKPSLVWIVNVFYWPSEERKYELRLGIESVNFTVYSTNNWPQYDPSAIDTIFRTMTSIASIERETLILFTDEASEGVFLEHLRKDKSDINYLFELGIIPKSIKWLYQAEKFVIVSRTLDYVVYKSTSRYMDEFNKKK